MGIGIVSVATVWIGSIAVRLNLACRWAAKASRTRVKLDGGEWLDSTSQLKEDLAYATRSAGADFVWQTRDEARIAHEDSRFDHVDGGCGQRDGRVGVALIWISTSAEGVIHDLTALPQD
jgi:hypothetical protein